MSCFLRPRPDLVVHPLFYRYVRENADVRDSFDTVAEPSRLTYSDDVTASVVLDGGAVTAMRVELEPYYTTPTVGVGANADVTTYTLARSTPMYRVVERAPRYVIWTSDDALTVCATVVARTEAYGLAGAVRAAVDWARNISITRNASVAVFDLDRTLVDDDDRILDGALSALEQARVTFDRVILWSHGSPLHVDRHVAELGFRFDLVLSNDGAERKSAKNLLHLYNYFVDAYFTRAVLIDDSVFNWTPEYTHCVVPATVGSVARVTHVLDRIAAE